ncbi:MAG: holo-[acyl-carrier-protein] synthase [PVC group bacterium]|nr:holo-[acyl-carrier-protein] synthase [PVC group bacterium]
MMISCGTDILETQRMKNAVQKWDQAFLKRIFTEKEIEYSMGKRFYFEHLAARFAAKEAVFKAFGEGFSSANFKDIEIVNDKNGRPSVLLKGAMQELSNNQKVDSIAISMSHTRNYAQAMAIITRKSEEN